MVCSFSGLSLLLSPSSKVAELWELCLVSHQVLIKWVAWHTSVKRVRDVFEKSIHPSLYIWCDVYADDGMGVTHPSSDPVGQDIHLAWFLSLSFLLDFEMKIEGIGTYIAVYTYMNVLGGTQTQTISLHIIAFGFRDILTATTEQDNHEQRWILSSLCLYAFGPCPGSVSMALQWWWWKCGGRLPLSSVRIIFIQSFDGIKEDSPASYIGRDWKFRCTRRKVNR